MGKAAAEPKEKPEGKKHGNAGLRLVNDPLACGIPSTILRDPRKLRAVQMLADGAATEMTYVEIAELCGVTDRTLLTWRQSEDFQEAILKIARATLKEAIPSMYKTLADLLKSKDLKLRLRAVELATRLTGEMVERSESKVSVVPDAKAILEGLRHEIESLEDHANEDEKQKVKV